MLRSNLYLKEHSLLFTHCNYASNNLTILSNNIAIPSFWSQLYLCLVDFTLLRIIFTLLRVGFDFFLLLLKNFSRLESSDQRWSINGETFPRTDRSQWELPWRQHCYRWGPSAVFLGQAQFWRILGNFLHGIESKCKKCLITVKLP